MRIPEPRDPIEALDTVTHIDRELAIGLAFPADLSVAFAVHWRSWMLDRRIKAVERASVARSVPVPDKASPKTKV